MTPALKLFAQPPPRRKDHSRDCFGERHVPLLLALARSTGCTDEELGLKLNDGKTSNVRSRRAELVRFGLVKDSGTTRVKTTGRKSTVWRCTPAGRRKAKSLQRRRDNGR